MSSIERNESKTSIPLSGINRSSSITQVSEIEMSVSEPLRTLGELDLEKGRIRAQYNKKEKNLRASEQKIRKYYANAKVCSPAFRCVAVTVGLIVFLAVLLYNNNNRDDKLTLF